MATPCGTIEITESADSGNVSITDCSISATDLSPGEETTASVTVENTNDTSINATIQLFVNGDPVDSAGELVPANGEVTVQFTVAFDNTGSFDISSTVTTGSLPSAPNP